MNSELVFMKEKKALSSDRACLNAPSELDQVCIIEEFGRLTFVDGRQSILLGEWHAVWLLTGFGRKCQKTALLPHYQSTIAC